MVPHGTFGNNHGASMVELPGGGMLVAWFAGQREGAGDTRILLSRCAGSGCSAPATVVTAGERAQGSLLRRRTVGNCALFLAEDGTLWLFYNAVAIGGWAGSVVDYKVSRDLGRSWSPGRNLLGELGTLVRGVPLSSGPGRILLPVYNGLGKAQSYACLITHQAGAPASVSCGERTAEDGGIQPSIARLPNGRLLALMRDKRGRSIRRAWSSNEGMHWSAVDGIGLPNPDSSVALAALDDGRLLLAYNPTGRNVLALAISRDQGATFEYLKDFESSPDSNAEFSYPVLLQAKDGLIHLAYTHWRKSIKHAVFDKAWLNAPPRGALRP